MNKIFISLAALLSIGAIVFAQVPGGVGAPENRPGNGQGGGRGGQGGGGISVTCNEKFLFVITNGTILKYDVTTMTKLSETKLPNVSQSQGGGRRVNPPTN